MSHCMVAFGLRLVKMKGALLCAALLLCAWTCTGAVPDVVFPSATERSSFLEEFRAAHPVRVASRATSGSTLYSPLQAEAMLFFRSMDADRDKLLSKEDVLSNAQTLASHIPGVSADEFASFIEEADLDGDHKLNINELMSAFEQGLQGTEMVETAEKATARSRKGFLSGVKNWVGGKINQLANKFQGKIDTKEDGCIMCQYIVERCEVNVRQTGVVSQTALPPPGPLDAASFAELEATTTSTTATAATTAATAAASQPFESEAAQIIGQNRQATRYSRLLERQKYNEIYRVVDVTLDDVCEQGMPNNLYGYCKAIYQTQADVVDGLRYQYRPDDICYRVGMCRKGSYITQGIHSRYKDLSEGHGGHGNTHAHGPTFPHH